MDGEAWEDGTASEYYVDAVSVGAYTADVSSAEEDAVVSNGAEVRDYMEKSGSVVVGGI